MTDLEKIAVLVERQERVVAGVKYALRRTTMTLDLCISLREEAQKLNDLLALEQEMRRAS
jgi:hypothetical protein